MTHTSPTRQRLLALASGIFLSLALSACGGGSGSNLPEAEVGGRWTAYYELSQDPCHLTDLPMGYREQEYLLIAQNGADITISYPDALERPAPIAYGSVVKRRLKTQLQQGSYREDLDAYVALDGIMYQATLTERDPVRWGSSCRIVWRTEIWPGWR